MNKGEFIHLVQGITGIQDRGKAEQATTAVLGTLCGRLTRDEAMDLEAQLPNGIDSMCQGNILTSLIKQVTGPNRLDRDAFLDRVAERQILIFNLQFLWKKFMTKCGYTF